MSHLLAYKDAPSARVTAHWVYTWRRGEIASQIGGSSGPKDYWANMIFALFAARAEVQAITMYVARGTPFLVYSDGEHVVDALGRAVIEVRL